MWLFAPWQQAKVLQRPLPAGALQIVARVRRAIGAGDI
jgi:hypothetical protein